MAKSNRIKFSDIEAKYDVKMDYFEQICFITNDYVKDRYIKTDDDKYTQVHHKDKSRNKKNKTINDNRKFSSINNKLREYHANGLEIDIDKTYVYGNKYKELYIIFK